MNNRFCLGEIVSTKADFLNLIKTEDKNYQYFEVWLDFIEDLDLEFIETLLANHSAKLIFLFRRNDQADNNLSEKLRQQYIKILSEHEILIDFDFQTQKSDLDFFLKHNKQAKLLLSLHDYQETPDTEQLENLLLEMRKMPAAIYKIACLCQDKKAANRLLMLSANFKSTDLVVLGAGESGLITRFAAFINEQPIIYAPRSKDKFVIAGQLTREQYRQLSDILAD